MRQWPPFLVREENTSGSKTLGGVRSPGSGDSTARPPGLRCAAEEVSLPEFPALCLAERIAGSIFEEFNHHGGKGEIFLKIYFLIYMYE